MTPCNHPELYRQALAALPETQQASPAWKVALYILTSTPGLWETARWCTQTPLELIDWTALGQQQGLSDPERALVDLAAGLCASQHPVDLAALCARLDDHTFEVAERALRFQFEFQHERIPL